MGQYYNIIFLSDTDRIRAWTYPRAYGYGVKLMEHAYLNSKVLNAIEWLISPEGLIGPSRIVWAGDYADPEPNGVTLYKQTDTLEENYIRPEPKNYASANYRFIVNHTKRLYVDKTHLTKDGELTIHPLALLTAEGNGRGGGDYRGSNEHLVGTWARDLISLESYIPEGFEELECDFRE